MITVRLYNLVGQKASNSFPDTATPAQIDAFYAAASKAGVSSATKSTPVTFTETDPVGSCSVDRQLVAVFRAVQTREDTRFTLPCPKAVGEPTKHGRKLTNAERSQYLSAWVTVNALAASYKLQRNAFKEKV